MPQLPGRRPAAHDALNRTPRGVACGAMGEEPLVEALEREHRGIDAGIEAYTGAADDAKDEPIG